MRRLKERLRVLYQYRSLFYQLVSRDIKLKYRRSYLGYLWSVLNPLLLMMVMTAVFSQMFKRDIPNFPAYLISGQVLFSFMTEATREAMVSITNNASLLKKTYVPKYIFTVSKITSSLVTLFLSFAALILVFLITGVRFRPKALLFFIPVLELYVFSIGLGLFLAQATVFFRDIQYIYSVITTAWMYLTPIFYSIESLPAWLIPLIRYLNPMYCYLMQFRCLLLEGQLASGRMLIAGVLWAGVALLVGIWSFVQSKDRFILYI